MQTNGLWCLARSIYLKPLQLSQLVRSKSTQQSSSTVGTDAKPTKTSEDTRPKARTITSSYTDTSKPTKADEIAEESGMLGQYKTFGKTNVKGDVEGSGDRSYENTTDDATVTGKIISTTSRMLEEAKETVVGLGGKVIGATIKAMATDAHIDSPIAKQDESAENLAQLTKIREERAAKTNLQKADEKIKHIQEEENHSNKPKKAGSVDPSLKS